MMFISVSSTSEQQPDREKLHFLTVRQLFNLLDTGAAAGTNNRDQWVATIGNYSDTSFEVEV